MVINKSAVIKFVIDPVIVIVVITCVPLLVTVHISLVRVGHELAVVQVVLPSVIVVVPVCVANVSDPVRIFVGLCRVVHTWTVVARVSDPVTVAVQLLRVGYFHTIVKRVCYSVAINVI